MSAEALEIRFHCGSERHLFMMKSRLAVPLYNLAGRLSAKTGLFYASQVNVAAYFSVHRETVLKTYKELADAGFLEVKHERIERFKPNAYRVVTHKEWATLHPGKCVEAISFP